MAEYMNVICKYGDTIEIEMEKKDKMQGNRNSAVHPPEKKRRGLAGLFK